jgi:hypothetical protein
VPAEVGDRGVVGNALPLQGRLDDLRLALGADAEDRLQADPHLAAGEVLEGSAEHLDRDLAGLARQDPVRAMTLALHCLPPALNFTLRGACRVQACAVELTVATFAAPPRPSIVVRDGFKVGIGRTGSG